jgi:hypothetical protein
MSDTAVRICIAVLVLLMALFVEIVIRTGQKK